MTKLQQQTSKPAPSPGGSQNPQASELALAYSKLKKQNEGKFALLTSIRCAVKYYSK